MPSTRFWHEPKRGRHPWNMYICSLLFLLLEKLAAEQSQQAAQRRQILAKSLLSVYFKKSVEELSRQF